MKKILAVMALAMMLVWGVGVNGASAGTIDFFAHDSADAFAGTCGPDGTISIELTQVSTGSYGLDYSTDKWASYTRLIDPGAGVVVNTGFTLTNVGVSQLVSFRLTDGSTGGEIYQGTMEFSGASLCDPTLFTKIVVEWDDSYGSIEIVNSCEGFSPVPIPATAWLLGSGLFGLIGIRRRMQK